MNIKDYISSGKLELYVYGVLSQEENNEIRIAIGKYPELQEEVEKIEAALLRLSAAAAPYSPQNYEAIRENISSQENNVRTLPASKSPKWILYSGWAASIVLLIGLFVLFDNNNDLKDQLSSTKSEISQLEEQIADVRQDSEKTRELLNSLRGRNISRVALQGQEAAPEAFATVYWNTSSNQAYIDAKELPEPPRGMVYQVWSLKLDPLTPTSIGLLEDFQEDENRIFVLNEVGNSEAFGITLEPEGGSESPTLERLYVLGTVGTS